MESYSWEEMSNWKKIKLIERIRALEHELSRPIEFRRVLDKNDSK